MKFVKINPPGTFCTQEALRDALKRNSGKTFLDVGCGGGTFSKLLCDAGFAGVGIDFSKQALEIAEKLLDSYIKKGQFSLQFGDVHDLSANFGKVDIAISYMVMEHVEDDVGFINKISQYVKPGGTIILAVPGRRDRWSLEDETVGHFRRYDRGDLDEVMRNANLEQVTVWSVGVPTINLLFKASVWTVARAGEAAKVRQSRREQTETSGIREIPWKTVFPVWVKIILNRTTLYPLFLIQRIFYRTGLGVVMMGIGRVPG